MSVSRYIIFAVLSVSVVLVTFGTVAAQPSAKWVSVEDIHQQDGGNVYTVAQTWEKPWNGSASPPVVAGGHLYVSSESHVKKLNRTTGKTVWASQIGEYEPKITVSDGTLFVTDGSLHRISLESGDRLWSFNRSDIVTTPTADDDGVYVGSRSGTVYSVDRETGEINWRTGLVNDFVPPAVEGAVVSKVESGTNKLYAGGLNSLYSLDKKTGKVVWERDMEDDMRSSPEYSDGRIYINDGDYLRALNAENGVPVWNTETEGGPNGAGHPTVSNGTVYFTDLKGKVYSVNKTTGDTNWRLDVGSVNINPPPSIDQGNVYVSGGNVTAVPMTSGEIGWWHETGGATAAANGSLYVNSGSRLYAVSPVPEALGKDRVVDVSESFASFPHINIADEGIENSTVVIRLDGYSEEGITLEKVVLSIKEVVVSDSFEVSVDGPSEGNFTEFIRRTGTVPIGRVSFDQSERPGDWMDGMNASLEVNASDLRILGEKNFDTLHIHRKERAFSEVHRQEMDEETASVRFGSRGLSDFYVGLTSEKGTGSVLYLNDIVFVGPTGTRKDSLVSTDTESSFVGELEVTNIGTRTADRSLRVSVGDRNVRTANLNLRPGESRKVSFEGSMDESGSYNISVNGHRVGRVSVQKSNDISGGSFSEVIELRRGLVIGTVLIFLVSAVGIVAIRRRYTR